MFYFYIILCMYTCISKEIKIQIDTDDIPKLMKGLMSSETFMKFANQIVHRTVGKYHGYANPYHPEDDFISILDEATKTERTTKKSNTKVLLINDPLDKENDNFILDSQIVSHDEVTDNESKKYVNNELRTTSEEKKGIFKTVNTYKTALKSNESNETNDVLLSRKDGVREDKSNVNLYQKRFLLKKSQEH